MNNPRDLIRMIRSRFPIVRIETVRTRPLSLVLAGKSDALRVWAAARTAHANA